MSFFAWPLAIVILGVVFIFVFRQQIGRLLDRTKSVGKGGLRAYDEPQVQAKQPSAIMKFLEGYHSPLLLEAETLIDKEVQQRGLTDITEVNLVLRKSLAGFAIILAFERTLNTIFASQVAALAFLNGRSGLTPKSDLRPMFELAVTTYPKLYEGWSLDGWLAYPKAQLLILEQTDGLAITVRGREFLKWRIDEGRSEPHYG